MLSKGDQARWLGVASALWADVMDLKDYRDEYHVKHPLTLDRSGHLFREFAVNETPTIIVIDTRNIIVKRIVSSELSTLPQVSTDLAHGNP